VNWRAFGLGAAFAAIVALVGATVALSLDSPSDSSLGGVTADASVGAVATAETIPAMRWLELDADALVADPCAVLADPVRAAFSVDAAPRADGEGRCVAGGGDDGVEVEVQVETAVPQALAGGFLDEHGGTPRPVPALGLAYASREGSGTLVGVFAPGLSVRVLIPTLDTGDPGVDAVRQALLAA
jgi:hypothetical protein